ncbi:alpha/beta hydrolase [Brevibacterium salitolerans]|uniref:Alpha/beta hydrolase fold-3 domain-containing protein n=1 Tax=Brevibacterium salitolerans TaxID=1403566 RepID=A0ABN2W995_9MICO
MTLDAASQSLLAQLAAAGSPPVHESTPAVARMSGPVLAQLSGPGPEVDAVAEHDLPAPDGGSFRVRVLTPPGRPAAVVVYLHGGGWVTSDIDYQYDTMARQLALASGTVLVMVNYRKAPEHPFPAAVEDSWAGLLWADAHRAELAGADVPLVIAGDSAGGNLAAVMAQRARDRGGPHLDLQILVYPVTDCDFSRPSYNAPENQLLLSRPTMEWFWHHYLPDPQARTQPDASPLRHPDLRGLPPAYVLLAEHDPLFDEGLDYARALEAAGVPVECETAEGQMHIFFQMANLLPGYAEGLEKVAARIRTVAGAEPHAHPEASTDPEVSPRSEASAHASAAPQAATPRTAAPQEAAQ